MRVCGGVRHEIIIPIKWLERDQASDHHQNTRVRPFAQEQGAVALYVQICYSNTYSYSILLHRGGIRTMGIETLVKALDHLDRKVAGLETTLAKLETRPKSRDGQFDLFAGPAMVMAATPISTLDPFEISQRLDRAIAQIEDVLQGA